MKVRTVGSLAVAVAVAWLSPSSTASAQSIEGAGTIPVMTSRGLGLPQGNITIAAHIVPGTGATTGVVRVRIPGFAEATADVTAMAVGGNVGVAGGPIRAGGNPFGLGYMYVLVVDNGNGRAVDDALVVLTDSDASGFLPFLVDIFGQFAGPVQNGGYKVSD
jgi:hypothetical protein